MTHYRIDPDRSTVSAVTRPMLDGRGPLDATISGAVVTDDADTSRVGGEIQIHLVGAATTVTIDVAGTSPELDHDRDGHLVLRGSSTRPAGAFALTGPPLLNPTVVLRWTAALVPDD